MQLAIASDQGVEEPVWISWDWKWCGDQTGIKPSELEVFLATCLTYLSHLPIQCHQQLHKTMSVPVESSGRLHGLSTACRTQSSVGAASSIAGGRESITSPGLTAL